MNILIWMLSIGLALFQIADFWTTTKVLKLGGYEANKLEAWLIAVLGVIPALIITKGYAAILALLGAYMGWWGMAWYGIPMLAFLVALFGWYGVVVNNNLAVYKKMK